MAVDAREVTEKADTFLCPNPLLDFIMRATCRCFGLLHRPNRSPAQEGANPKTHDILNGKRAPEIPSYTKELRPIKAMEMPNGSEVVQKIPSMMQDNVPVSTAVKLM